jgi:hypothetical protein
MLCTCISEEVGSNIRQDVGYPEWRFSRFSSVPPNQFRVGTSVKSRLCRGADKFLAFLIPIFLFAGQPKEFFLDGLKKLEQRSHKCVELRGGICRVNTFFFNLIACCFVYKAKDFSAPLVFPLKLYPIHNSTIICNFIYIIYIVCDTGRIIK